MKVALLSFYSGHNNRGVETWAQELSQLVTVYPADKNVNIDWTKPQQKYSFLRKLFLDYWSRKIFSSTRQILKNMPKDTDIIIPANGGWQTLLCKLWVLKHHKKLIVVGQSGKGWDDRINLLLAPNVFVALTKDQASWARKNSFVKNIQVIPNGVDTQVFSPVGPKFKLDLPHPVILTVAALEKDKNIATTIEAVAKIPSVSLLIVGSGPEEQVLKNLAQKLLPGRYQFISMPHADMPKIYRSADVFTFLAPPWESFGIVYLEAMATGLPVVASDDPVRHEIIGTAGYFASSQDYSSKLKLALQEKNNKHAIPQAEKFSWVKIVEAYDRLFNNPSL